MAPKPVYSWNRVKCPWGDKLAACVLASVDRCLEPSPGSQAPRSGHAGKPRNPIGSSPILWPSRRDRPPSATVIVSLGQRKSDLRSSRFPTEWCGHAFNIAIIHDPEPTTAEDMAQRGGRIPSGICSSVFPNCSILVINNGTTGTDVNRHTGSPPPTSTRDDDNKEGIEEKAETTVGPEASKGTTPKNPAYNTW